MFSFASQRSCLWGLVPRKVLFRDLGTSLPPPTVVIFCQGATDGHSDAPASWRLVARALCRSNALSSYRSACCTLATSRLRRSFTQAPSPLTSRNNEACGLHVLPPLCSIALALFRADAPTLSLGRAVAWALLRSDDCRPELLPPLRSSLGHPIALALCRSDASAQTLGPSDAPSA